MGGRLNTRVFESGPTLHALNCSNPQAVTCLLEGGGMAVEFGFVDLQDKIPRLLQLHPKLALALDRVTACIFRNACRAGP